MQIEHVIISMQIQKSPTIFRNVSTGQISQCFLQDPLDFMHTSK